MTVQKLRRATRGRTAYSYDGIDEFWMGLRASFPNAKFEVIILLD